MDVPHIEPIIIRKEQNISIPLFRIKIEYNNTFLNRDLRYPFMKYGTISVDIKVFIII